MYGMDYTPYEPSWGAPGFLPAGVGGAPVSAVFAPAKSALAPTIEPR